MRFSRGIHICLLIVIPLFLFTACTPMKTFTRSAFSSYSPTKTVFYKKPENAKTVSYHIIEIPNFTKTQETWVPYDSYTLLPDMLAEKLRTSDSFKEILRTDSDAPAGEKVLLVEGRVINYDRGCKFCEWIIRVNDKGKSTITVRVKLIDKSTGDILADTEIAGRAKAPGWGKYRYERIVDELTHLIEEVNGQKTYSKKQ